MSENKTPVSLIREMTPEERKVFDDIQQNPFRELTEFECDLLIKQLVAHFFIVLEAAEQASIERKDATIVRRLLYDFCKELGRLWTNGLFFELAGFDPPADFFFPDRKQRKRKNEKTD